MTMNIISDIPVFGVLTKKDQITKTNKDQIPAVDDDEQYRSIQNQFKKALGLPSHRFLLMSNYCDEVNPTKNHLTKVRLIKVN